MQIQNEEQNAFPFIWNDHRTVLIKPYSADGEFTTPENAKSPMLVTLSGILTSKASAVLRTYNKYLAGMHRTDTEVRPLLSASH